MRAKYPYPTVEKVVKQDVYGRLLDKYHQAVKEGMILMKQDGFLKALTGITTLEEIMRVTEE